MFIFFSQHFPVRKIIAALMVSYLSFTHLFIGCKKIHRYVNCFYIKKKFLLFTFNRFFFSEIKVIKENYDKLYVTLFSVYLQKVAGLF